MVVRINPGGPRNIMKLILMKCKHYADCFLYIKESGEDMTVAACSLCFNDYGTINQPACCMENKNKNTFGYGIV